MPTCDTMVAEEPKEATVLADSGVSLSKGSQLSASTSLYTRNTHTHMDHIFHIINALRAGLANLHGKETSEILAPISNGQSMVQEWHFT